MSAKLKSYFVAAKQTKGSSLTSAQFREYVCDFCETHTHPTAPGRFEDADLARHSHTNLNDVIRIGPPAAVLLYLRVVPPIEGDFCSRINTAASLAPHCDHIEDIVVKPKAKATLFGETSIKSMFNE